MKLNDKVYNVLKWVALIVLDAVGVAYEQLAGVWGLPYGTEIMRTCAIFSVLIGSLIGVSTYSYNKKLDYQDYEDAGDDEDEQK